ncbi:hypothetical protein, conserved [Leishmania tarentolae]|uniref:Uncharacterized protein n=1 Tax=Leishmania tarentolae TaxID=5689 RepID=A0A640KC21_LEITA|nr:hypothetical protein, conserved [Leishmania tarentolae]
MLAKRFTALTRKSHQDSGARESSLEHDERTPAKAFVSTDGVSYPYCGPSIDEEERSGIPAVAATSRGGAVSRLLTPPTTPCAESMESRHCFGSHHSRSESSVLYHSGYSSSSRSSVERAGTASPTLVSAYGRSYRHNPYIVSPSTTRSPRMPESPASMPITEHERAKDLSIGGGCGTGEQGRRCIIRSGHTRSLSPSTSRCGRALARPIAGVAYHDFALQQPQQLATTFPLRHSAGSFSCDGSFLGRSAPSSVDQSCRSSPATATAPLTMRLASAPSFRGPNHGAQHYHSPRPPSSTLYSAGGNTPESLNLYQSLGSVHATASTNSNNPYIGVRMAPERPLLHPQSVTHGLTFETGPRAAVLEINTRSLSFQDAQTLESSPSQEPNPHEKKPREAQQTWVTSTLPMQMVPVYAHGSRHSSPQASPVASALGEGSRRPSGAARTASEGCTTMAKLPPALTPTALNQHAHIYLEPRSPVLQQQQQQQRVTPQQRALHISPSHSSAISAAGSTTISVGGICLGDAGRTHSVACDATRQLSPLPAIASAGTPVLSAEMELPHGGYSNSSPMGTIANADLQRQKATIYATSPCRPCTAVSPARPQCAAHSPLSTSPHSQDACAHALHSTQTGLPGATESEHTTASTGTAAAPLHSHQRSSSDAGTCSADSDKAKGDIEVRRPSHESDGGALSANCMPAHTPAEIDASQGQLSPSVLLMPAAATSDKGDAMQMSNASHSLSGAVAYQAQDEHDVVNTDGDGQGGNDDEGGSISAPGAGQGKKKKRVRRSRKGKILEDLPPVTFMKYLPPPPPPPLALPSPLDPAGAPSNVALSSSAFDRYYAVLLRWYTRLLADEADFVDIAAARSFDAATAAATMSAEARQARDSSYASVGKPPSAYSLECVHSGPISSPMGSVSSLLSKSLPVYVGSSGDRSGRNAEVHVRCPRIEQYVESCDIPAELRLCPTAKTADTQATGAATVTLPHSVKDAPSIVRWARDLETWWFCYIFPLAAHTRYQPPAAWPQLQQASMPPGGLAVPHAGSGGVVQEYPYGWSTTTQPPMSSIRCAYAAQGSPTIRGGHPMISSGLPSPAVAHMPMQSQLPPTYGKGPHSRH